MPQVEQDPPSYQQPPLGGVQETQDVVEPPPPVYDPQSEGQEPVDSPESQTPLLLQAVVDVVDVEPHFIVPQVEHVPPSYQHPVPGDGQETQEVVEPPQSAGQEV